jgi:hypothetical protein
VFSGNMLAQTGPFDAASLKGNLITYQTANYDQTSYELLTTATLALFAPDGAGNLPLTSADQNAGGNLHNPSGITYTYTVAANGQATIYTSPSIVGGRWYMTGPNTGLMLGFDYGVSTGAILPQAAGPFSAASISGDFLASQTPGASLGSTNSSGVATSNGGGTLATTLDLNFNGAFIAGQTATGTLTVAPNGRATDTNANVIYMVSPSTFLLMNESSSNSNPMIQLFEQ